VSLTSLTVHKTDGTSLGQICTCHGKVPEL